jgi:hypothetical protein
VATTTSSSRKRKSFQIVESKWWLCSSRFFSGQTRASAVVISVLLAYRVLPVWSSEALISTRSKV